MNQRELDCYIESDAENEEWTIQFRGEIRGEQWEYVAVYDKWVGDYQIDGYQTDGMAYHGPGGVERKWDAIAYILEQFGVIEESGVQPTDPYTT